MERSVTQLIAELKGGDQEAARELWERFFGSLCAYARRKVQSRERRERDEEDLALSAMNALFVGARDGRFRRLESREDLWMLLTRIASNKAISHHRRTRARNVLGESVLGTHEEALALERLVSSEPDASFLDSLSLTCQELLDSLDERTRVVALLKLEGYSNEEVAARIERSIRSVERYLFIIRSKWCEG